MTNRVPVLAALVVAAASLCWPQSTTYPPPVPLVVSVLTYGADPTGTRDSTTQIATAIAASGGHAYIPPGTYLLSGVTIPDSYDLGGSGPDTIVNLTGNNTVGFTLNGGHANVHDLRITKATGTTGVTGILVTAASAIASYNKIFRVRIEGNGPSDLIASAVKLQSGTALGCGGGDCGVFYTSLEDIDTRYATDDFLITGTGTVPSNATSGLNLRGGDSTNCYHIVQGESNRILNLSCEGDTKGIWIETDTIANNNNNVFLGYRREANTTDVEVDASSFSNMVQSASLVPANITDNGVGTTFISADNLLQLVGGIVYSSVDGILHLTQVNGVSVTNGVTAGGTVTVNNATPLKMTSSSTFQANIGTGIMSGSSRDFYWTAGNTSDGYAWFTRDGSGTQKTGGGIDRNGNWCINCTAPAVTGLTLGASSGIQAPALKSITGQRYVCVDSSGNLVSSATACSGT